MAGYIIDEKQPFGVVHNIKAHPGEAIDLGFGSKTLGPDTVHSNHGLDHGPSFADHGAGGASFASRGNANPFVWVEK